MRDKVAAVAGATAGWGGAFTLIFTGDSRRDVLAQAFLIGVGMVGAAWLMLCCHNRPMLRAFELGCHLGREEGYAEGRADAAAEAGGGRVVRLRQDRQGWRVSV